MLDSLKYGQEQQKIASFFCTFFKSCFVIESESESHSVVSNSLRLYGLGILQARILE